MEYDRGDSFPYDFEPNRFLFGSISEEEGGSACRPLGQGSVLSSLRIVRF